MYHSYFGKLGHNSASLNLRIITAFLGTLLMLTSKLYMNTTKIPVHGGMLAVFAFIQVFLVIGVK